MTATTTLTDPTTRHTTARSVPAKQLWRTGAVAGLGASAATIAVAALARAFDVSLEVGGEAIPLLGFAQLTFVAAMIGTVIALVARRASRPRRTFVTTTIVLTVLSIVPDVTADAHTATKVALALTHLVAAAIVIPALASRAAD